MFVIFVCLLLGAFGHTINAEPMTFLISKSWNSIPITDHQPIQISLSSDDNKEHLLIEIDAPFFNDTAPPPTSTPPPGSYSGLWNYEVIELFFLSSKTNRYLQLEFSPHGYYFVLLFGDRRKEHKLQFALPDYTIERPSSDRWIGRAKVPRSLFPAYVDRFNAAAMHGPEDQRVYQLLYSAAADSEKPDFHDLELFQPIDFDSVFRVNERDGDDWNTK